MENYTNPAGDAQETPVSNETENTYTPYESRPYRYSYSNFGVPQQACYESDSKPPQKERNVVWVMILALCFSVFGSAIGAGGVLLAQHYMDQETVEVISPEIYKTFTRFPDGLQHSFSMRC